MVYGFNVQFNMIFVTASPQKPSTTLSYLFGRQTVSELDRDRGPSVCCWRAAAAGLGLTWTSFSLLALAVPWLAAPLVLVHPAQMSLRLAQRILQSSSGRRHLHSILWVYRTLSGRVGQHPLTRRKGARFTSRRRMSPICVLGEGGR